MTQGEEEGLLLAYALLPAMVCCRADVPVVLILVQSGLELLWAVQWSQACLVKKQLEAVPAHTHTQ